MADRRRILALASLLLLALPTPAALAQDTAAADRPATAIQLTDGPYVAMRDDGFRATSIDRDGAAVATTIAGNRIRVPAVGDIPSFGLALRSPPPVAASANPLPAGTPLFVLADTHGEYSILIALIKAQGLVDDQLRWKFGKGQLVVTGDMLDRGPRQLEILWLFYKLEAEASRAGGRVHVLIGNHEALVLSGDQRYLNPRYPEIAKRLGVSSYSELLGPDTVLGSWLRSRPAVFKLGDLLLLHGGISPELMTTSLSLDTINAIVRRHLDIPHDQKPAIGSDDAVVMGNNGPLWYRGYFPIRDKPAEAGDVDVTAALVRFGVSRILVGHTIVESVRSLYGGKVIAVQVYPHLDEKTGAPVLEGALLLKGRWYRATAQGERIPLDLVD